MRENVFLIKIIVVLMILTGGVVYGLHEHRIPNWWVFGGADIGMGLLWWLSMGNAERAWEMPVWPLVRCMVVSMVFFPLFHVGMVGAEDIKLMTIIRGFLGPWDGSLLIVYGFLTGATMPLIKMLMQGTLFRRLNYLCACVRRLIFTKEVAVYHDLSRDGYTHAMPFGLCLSLGVLVYLFFTKG